MEEKQKDIDFLFLQLHVVKGAREILVKFDQIAKLAGLQESHPLIEEIVAATIRLLQRLQKEIDLKKTQIKDRMKQQSLLSQKISMQTCIESLTQEPINLDTARDAMNAVLELAPETARRAK